MLISAKAVRQMAPGGVIVDLAAERGGNCELTRPGEVVRDHGVTIIGPLNIPSTVPYHASQMVAKNMAAFVTHLLPQGVLRIDGNDEIVQSTVVTRDGAVVHPRIRQLLESPAT